MLRQLTAVHDLISPDLDASSKADIYNSIIYMALYQPPPDGFSKAIEWGEEYTKGSNLPNGSLWLNLAAANGQKYEYMKENPGNLAGDSLEEVRKMQLRRWPLSYRRSLIQV